MRNDVRIGRERHANHSRRPALVHARANTFLTDIAALRDVCSGDGHNLDLRCSDFCDIADLLAH